LGRSRAHSRAVAHLPGLIADVNPASDPNLDATGTAAAIRDGQITATQAVEAALDRLHAWNPHLNAVIHLDDRIGQRLETAPSGPLTGVPFLLKDLGAAEAGQPHHMGNRLLKAVDFRSPSDSYLARRFREAGLVVLGRTNTPEFGLTATTEPAAFGPTRNPWDLTRSAGGSSGGSAAAIAAGIVPAAHGNDGGGSIRIPAAVNGLVGFKSTRGRVSNGPDLGEAWAGLAHQGAITRTVRDAALMLDIISGYEIGDPYTAPTPARPFSQEVGTDPGRLRVIVMPVAPGYACDPQVAEACRATGRLLAALGHQVEETVPAPFTRLDEVGDAMYRLFASCTAHSLSTLSHMAGRTATLDDVEPLTAYHAARGLQQTPVDYLDTVNWIHAFAREVIAQWRQFDIMVTPTVAELALPLGELAFAPANPQRSLDRMIAFMPFTAVFNMTGQPAVSLPLYMSSEGLPIGIQLAADWARDDLLLRVAAQLEAASPWIDRRPRLPTSGLR